MPVATEGLGAAAFRVHTLHPGDVACVDRGDRMETLLGSCVSIVLTDPRRTVGAMCHVVHAKPALRGTPNSTAHGDTALQFMFSLLRARGIEPRLCHAWAYGGGNMFPMLVGSDAAQGNVGAANGAWAEAALARAGIHVLGGELGGNVYRRLRWTVGPGDPELDVMPSQPQGATA
jgi:chemotaxis protein CheD